MVKSIKKWKPSKAELVEIRRRLFVARCSFSLLALQGMSNTNQHILSLVLPYDEVEWFEECILYMKQRVRQEKDEAKLRKP